MPAKRSPAPRTRSTGSVGELLAKLEHPRKAEIEALRAIILHADPRVREEVKWNAPSFYIMEHFATFKLRPLETVQVVFHTGAKVKPDAAAVEIEDPEGLLSWPAKDRCVATLSDMKDIETRGAAFAEIVKQWIARAPVATK